MISKIVLCTFPDRITAGFWRMGRLAGCESFLNNAAGHEAFHQFLRKHKDVSIYLIADAVEEDYRVETMPHTSGNARRALLDRRLGQLYRTTAYRAAHFLGREKEKRRDDIFLLMALNNSESINPWVQAIEDQRAPLAGVYLLPMVSQFLVDRLKLKEPHMLFTDNQVSGLRQTYFHEGRVRVSRLAPASNLQYEQLAGLYAAETEKARLYLLSQRLIGRETKLTLLVLSHGPDGEGICNQISTEQGVECMALDAFKLAKRFGLDAEVLRQFPELLYMHMLAKGGVPENLAPVPLTKHFTVHRLRIMLSLASLAILVVGSAMAALNMLNMLDYSGRIDDARAQTLLQERMYQDVAKNFPATPLGGNDLKTAVELSQAIADNAKTPQRLMLVAAAALDLVPEIQLQRLRWKLTEDINFKDEESQSSGSAPAGAPQSQAGTLFEIGFLDGEIRNFSGDYRAALESVNRLADVLRKDERVEEIVIVQQPVNVSSMSNLQGSTLDAQAQQIPAAKFKLKIVLKRVVKTS